MTVPITDTPGWHLTHDLDRFLDRAGPHLRSTPAPHTVLLSVTDALRRSGLQAYGDEPPVFGTLVGEGGTVTGAWVRTPPRRLLLGTVPEDAVESLAATLADDQATAGLSGVTGRRPTVDAFATAWHTRTHTRTRTSTGAHPTPLRAERLYRLDTLTPPDPAPPGTPRPAIEADRDLLRRWHVAFARDIGERNLMDSDTWVDSRLMYAGLTLWEVDGTPVALAGVTRRIAGQVRVAPVYTPPDQRRRGYAAAVTAEVSRAARDGGADEVLLFTDLGNPTSNSVYQRIGYRPMGDFATYDFTATATP
ncbi:GNAT family N-acetyltransferase [Streptomyces sp. NPDC058001]|uniref:GNAT family N-acetyltransferase n=1 Tax=Streptomyces sp. NPDC058001 TaxID=3346300 RepID=UPI0036EB6691